MRRAAGTRWRVLAVVGAALAALSGPPVAAAAGSGPAGAAGLHVGVLTLHHCPAAPSAWCGSLPVPFDRTDPSAGTIGIGFMWFPASGRVDGTIVAVEGGPGFPSTGSRSLYLPLFRPLRAHHNLLLVDNRGTGMSALIRCPSLDTFHGVQPSPAFTTAVRQCADLLDHQRRRPDGTWVHGADLYGTANAARDMADVLTALETGPVDLYGNSYGTWFAQTFASRFPSLLHSVTLDASYQVLDLSSWYISTVTVSRTAFQAACQRSLACVDRGDGAVWARIGALASDLRTSPVDGTVVDNAGKVVRVHVDVRALVNVVNDAGIDPGIYRQLDAAAIALLNHGDATPLLQLTIQSVEFDQGGSSNPAAFSSGLYMAVACTDYPQLFDMRAGPRQRRSQLADRIADLPASTFAPFSTSEWLSMDAYTETYTSCIDWPAPVHHDPPIVKSPPLVPSSIPVLVLGGDLDTLTPSYAGGRVVARQMGPSARFVSVPNTTHVTAEGDGNHCASVIVQRFVAAPRTLPHLDTACTSDIPEVRMVGAFPRLFDNATPADPMSGNMAASAALRAVSVATATVGDAISRYVYLSSATGTGLRGGTFTSSDNGTVLTLRLQRSRWVTDAATSGTATWNRSTGVVTVTVTTATPDGSGSLTITWNTGEQRAEAVAGGSFDGQPVSAETPAP